MSRTKGIVKKNLKTLEYKFAIEPILDIIHNYLRCYSVILYLKLYNNQI